MAQTTTAYDESFTNGVTYSAGSTQFDNWSTFRAGPPASGISSVTISGSRDTTGRTCSDPALAQQIMDNFRTSTGSGGNTVVETTLTCGGFTWNTGNCAASGVGIELNAASSAILCSASTDQYVLRPKIGNANWGGINGATTSAPSQTMRVSYTTAAALPISLDEDFDDDACGTRPAGWTRTDGFIDEVSSTKDTAPCATQFRMENRWYETPALDLSGQSNLEIAFFLDVNTGAGEDFFVQYLPDGGAWTTFGTWTNATQDTQVSAVVPAPALSNNVKFRFLTDSDWESGDDAYVDTVRLQSTADPLIVTNTNDSGAGSLRDAITFANANAAEDAITFAIPGTGPHVISQLTALPTLTDDNVSIDGTSQNGTVCNTLVNGTPHVLKIQIDGVSSTDAEGLYVNADNVALSGLSITGFDSRGIRISGPSNNASVDCSYLGVNPDGTTKNANARGDSTGSVLVLAGDGATVTRSVMSGNDDDGGDVGVYISGESAVLTGNIIGLTADGSTALGNGNYGFNIRPTAINTTIGGIASSDRNIISGNGGSGIYIEGASNTSILGNYIGLGANGTSNLSNGGHGVAVTGADTLNIGNGTAGGRNIIDSTNIGINLTGTVSTISINDNYLNTDVSGNSSVVTGLDAIVITGQATTLDILDNVFGQVSQDKIEFWNSTTSTGVTVQGNKFGVGADGSTDISGGIGDVGIRVWSSHNVSGINIGGTGAGEGNIIANSGASGIYIDSATTGDIVGNTIHSNGADGVEIISTTAELAIYGNSINDNSGLGIDLGVGGVTTNDSGDGDTGANDLLNYPLINTLSTDGATALSYDFDLDVPANANGYRIDFYKDSNALVTDNGQGEVHLGFVDIAHAGGDLNFTGTFTTNDTVSVGNIITATTTRKTGASSYDMTSEFSGNEAASSPLVVTNTNDSGAGSLRDAITFANANTAEDDITFAIPGAGPFTITPTSALPAISDAGVTIDGTTQPGASCGQLTTGTQHTLMIELDGTGAGLTNTAFDINADSVTIKGMSIVDFDGHAVKVFGDGNNVLLECTYIGVETDGVTKGANAKQDGRNNAIRFLGVANAIVRNNLISGNDDDASDDGLRYDDVTGGTVEGNIIGLNAAGTAALGNGSDGILFNGTTSGVTIGGITPEMRNVISGNTGDGIKLDDVSDIDILGNYIGLGADGVIDLGDSVDGVFINGSTDVTIGGTAAGAQNIISGNTGRAVHVTGGSGTVTLLGNHVGVAADGSTAVPNAGEAAVRFDTASSGVIGGTAVGSGNVISGNAADGILIYGGSSVTILGNFIGTDSTGTVAVGNGDEGIVVEVSNATATIGDGTSAGRNVIAGNGGSQVYTRNTGSFDLNNNLVGIGIGGENLGGSEGAHAGPAGTMTVRNNIITNQSANGVLAQSADSVGAIYANSIFDNDELGIDLGNDDLTANDSGDPDTGANDLLNFPVINSVSGAGTTMSYDIDLDTVSNANGYRIDFYTNSAADPTGYGEGETHLGFIDVSHGGGNQTFTGTQAIAQGEIISATTTRKIGVSSYDVTSEFSFAYTSDAATELTAAERVDVFDPTSAGLYALPGNDIISSMTVTNIGNSAADANSIVIIDAVPSEMEFYYGDMDDGGPATDSIYFTQTGGANLTFTYATDAAFSNSPTRPSNMAGFTYTPSAGYDSNVTYVCFNPKGAMASGNPDPTFTAQFRARIK